MTENVQVLKSQHQVSLELAGFGDQQLNFPMFWMNKYNNYVQLWSHTVECSVLLYSNETILITQHLVTACIQQCIIK